MSVRTRHCQKIWILPCFVLCHMERYCNELQNQRTTRLLFVSNTLIDHCFWESKGRFISSLASQQSCSGIHIQFLKHRVRKNSVQNNMSVTTHHHWKHLDFAVFWSLSHRKVLQWTSESVYDSPCVCVEHTNWSLLLREFIQLLAVSDTYRKCRATLTLAEQHECNRKIHCAGPLTASAVEGRRHYLQSIGVNVFCCHS